MRCSVTPSSIMRSCQSRPRISNRSPWPPRPYDPSDRRGIRSGLSLCPNSALCGADAWILSPLWRPECGPQQADPNPQRRGPLPVCCLCRFAPCSCFQCQKGNVFYYWEKNMNGSFVGWSPCWFVQVFESPHDNHHYIPQNLTTTTIISLAIFSSFVVSV